MNECGCKEKQLATKLQTKTNREQTMVCVFCLHAADYTILKALNFPELQQTGISRNVLVP